jgi:chemotaxis-related protein WspB
MQCIAFEIDGASYAIPTHGIEEIAPMVRAAPLPDAPDWVRGVIDHRGRLIPLLDMRRLVGGDELSITAGTRIVIADARLRGPSATESRADDVEPRRRIALVVGPVHDVIDVDVQAADGFDGLPGGSMPHLGRLVPVAGEGGRRSVRLVDLDRVLSPEHREVLFGSATDGAS